MAAFPKLMTCRLHGPAIVAGALLAACAACAADSAASDAERRAMARLLDVIGEAGCRGDDQCRTVAVGAKGCGGPQAYLAWSSEQTSADAVARATAEHLAAQGAATLPGARFSTCAVVADPGAFCAATDGGRRCRLRDSGRAGDSGVGPLPQQ